MTFLVCLIIFVAISIVIIVLSFFTKHGQSDIRKSYIRQHRTTLLVLTLLWVCPIWVNLSREFFDDTDSPQFKLANILAFFSLVSSSGLVSLIRIFFDSYLKKRVLSRFYIDPEHALLQDRGQRPRKHHNH